MNVFFRVDSNKSIGLGHLMRCISIANSLRKIKVNCYFIVSNKKTDSIITDFGFKSYKIDTNSNEVSVINKLNKDNQIDFLVIDSKRRSIEKTIKFFKNKLKIILIDYISLQNVFLTILPGPVNKFLTIPKQSIYGLDYVLIQKPIKKNIHKEKNKIFLSTGGSDKFHITSKIVKTFHKTKSDFKMLINIGKFSEDAERIKKIVKNDFRFEIFVDHKNIPDLMSTCEIGIITFGITAYEAAFAKLPIFTIAHSNENNKSAKFNEKFGWLKHLGKHDDVKFGTLPEKISKLMKDKKQYKKMLKSCKIIDGKGSERIANILVKNEKKSTFLLNHDQ